MTTLTLDTHEMVKDLVASGFREPQAAAVTRAVKAAQEVDLSHLATRADLQIGLEQSKVEILKWVIGAMGVQTLAIWGGMVTLLKMLIK